MGEQIPNPQQGLGILLPRSNIAAPDPIVRMFNDAGMNAPPVPKTVAVSSKYSIDITPDEQAQWDRLRGRALKEIGAELVADPDFATAPIATRQKYLQKVLAQADKQATAQLLDQIDELPNGQLEQRVLDRLGQKVPVPKAGL